MPNKSSGEPVLRAHVLKSSAFGDAAPGRHLPYRIDLLRESGVELTWTDRYRQGWFITPIPYRVISTFERAVTPLLQTAMSVPQLRRADAVLAIFESEGHGLAMTRRLTRRLTRRGPALVIVSCWLADLAVAASPRRRALYRRLYRSVDLVTVFSSNQADTLGATLGIDRAKILVVPFGIDLDELATVPTADNGRVVAAGRDLGRDWATLVAAADGAGWQLDLITRPAQVEGITLPAGVDLHGFVARPQYLEHLASASVVVVPTHVREYPTGQTVLLEALALGKACVVTDTPAMREYVEHERSALLVPPHDPEALRLAVDRLLADGDLRSRLGAQGRIDASERFDAATMWRTIADAMRRTVGHR